ncbi:MAG: uroporphyrinogen decarboxylase family protein [Verrucomicrobiae bacterium]|nr:uroporphyrinogen decarboxylase family protein [Verrucomicrobiae bacterium]
MNAVQRVEAVLAGRIPDRVPVCLHNFLMAAEEAGVPLEDYSEKPEAAARAHLDAVERYRHDCILIDLDTTMLAEAMGAQRDCTPGETGHIAAPAIRSLEEVERLKPVDPLRDGRIPVLIEAVRIMAKAVGSEVAIRGNADQCAFSLAGMLRGMQEFLMDLVECPDDPRLTQLLEVAYQSHVAVHRALKAAGAHFTSLGDSPSGPDVVSPAIFRRFARPYQERLVRELSWPVVIHICGDTGPILDQLAEYPPCAFELDYKTDAVRAKATVGRGHVLFGNVDPSGVLARGSPALVREKTRELIAMWKPGGRFVLNAGCAIPANTPSENVRAFVETAREVGVYA